MRLVIVESPKKARTIRGLLGSGYRVAASMGHVRDLPANELGVDVARDFAPQYAILPRAKQVLASLRREVAGAEAVLLATDPDREGEAIAWHLAEALRLPRGRYRRITFHEISRRAIEDALAHPRDLDPHLIDAQQARRVLDRLVGYQLSPLLWRKVQRRTSAGRVQSVAVRLVVDREREIQAFVPTEYWTIDVRLSPELDALGVAAGPEQQARRGSHRGVGTASARASPPDPAPDGRQGSGGAASFLARLVEIDGRKAELPDAPAAQRVVAQLERARYRVRETGQKTITRSPFPPFTTSTLQQAAGTRLRFPARKTMGAAQSLYEAGLITYMRTDSVAVSAEAIAQARAVIEAEFGPEYVPPAPRRYATRTRNAQEAHEAIRPVDLARTPASLRATLPLDEWRLYDLIWKRMVASQMAPARYLQDLALIDATSTVLRDSEGPQPAMLAAQRTSIPNSASVSDGETPETGAVVRFLLKAQATTLVFRGWLAAYGDDADEHGAATAERGSGRSARAQRGAAVDGQDDGAANERLPRLEAGQALVLLEVLPAQHFTQPPRRYTEASLVKALEEAGVGRPSTYATILSTIQDRGYVRLEQRQFVPTELGYAANDFLVAHFPRIVDLPFTARMEDSLDEIANGRLPWTQMLRDFYGPFCETIARAERAPLTALKQQERVAAAAAPSLDSAPAAPNPSRGRKGRTPGARRARAPAAGRRGGPAR